MARTWSDSDFMSSDDEDEKSNDKETKEETRRVLMCLMVTDGFKHDKAIKEESTEVVIVDNSYKKLHDPFEDLLLENKSHVESMKHNKRKLS